MSIKEILEELPKLIPQEREAVLDWLVRDRLGANEFPEADEVVTGSDDTFQELVEKRIPIVIETVADYFPAELLDSYEETILWYLAGGYSGGLLLVRVNGWFETEGKIYFEPSDGDDDVREEYLLAEWKGIIRTYTDRYAEPSLTIKELWPFGQTPPFVSALAPDR
jgi:hypothetical protein